MVYSDLNEKKNDGDLSSHSTWLSPVIQVTTSDDCNSNICHMKLNFYFIYFHIKKILIFGCVGS